MKTHILFGLGSVALVSLISSCSPGTGDPNETAGDGDGDMAQNTGGDVGTGGGTPGTGGDVGPGTGGNGGSGGVPGGGGTDGSGGLGTGGTLDGTGGTPSGGATCQDADVFCEDFEATPVGDAPSTGWSVRDVSCGTMNFSMGVSEDRPRGASTRALKITNHSYAQCRTSRSFSTLDEFWVTAHIYWEPDVSFDDKEILAIDLHPDSGAGKDDPAVRFGNRSKDPCIANPGPQITMIGLGGGEATGCNDAIPIPKGQWYCFEAHVVQPDYATVKTYINGSELMYQSTGKPLESSVVSHAPLTEKVNNVRLGMFTHNSTGMGDVYVDDLSVSTTRLGCGQ